MNPVMFVFVMRIVELSTSGIFQRFLMQKISRVARVAAVCALVLSALAVSVAPAGADPAPTGSVTSTNDGTATITYSDTTDVEVYIIDGASAGCEDTGSAPTTGVLATLGVVNAMPASPVTVTTETQVGPLPLHALGTGSYLFCMYDVVGGDPYNWLNTENGTIGIFPPASASMVDNGNGTLTLTWNANSDFGEFVAVLFFSGITTCPEDLSVAATTLTGYGMQSNSESFGVGLPPSPAIIGVGTEAFVMPIVPGDLTNPFIVGPITAGQYLSCLYVSNGDGVGLAQSMPMGIGIVPEPVTPAFTG